MLMHRCLRLPHRRPPAAAPRMRTPRWQADGETAANDASWLLASGASEVELASATRRLCDAFRLPLPVGVDAAPPKQPQHVHVALTPSTSGGVIMYAPRASEPSADEADAQHGNVDCAW